MAGRTRTQKKLAQRIDLNYFKRTYPIPHWRRILSIGLTAVGLIWLIGAGVAGKQSAYNAGQLSHAHQLFTKDCNACHKTEAVWGTKVTDTACMSCHDGPIHQAQQTFSPACMDCHVDHKGVFNLSVVRDEACTQCHADLKTKNGQLTVAAKVTDFSDGHPEFKEISKPDPGTVKLNHFVHLGPNIRGAHGPATLVCADCHKSNGERMAPIVYETHCASCHPLYFDERITEAAPHKKPEIVLDFMHDKFTKYIAAHPDDVHKADPEDPRTMRPPRPPAKDAAEWIDRRMSDTKLLMYRKSCVECHTLNFKNGPDQVPTVPEAAIPARWFPNAEFDHQAHQMLVCTECHAKAPNSKLSSDVLIPGIDSCRQCHKPGADAADARCDECHVYHDWSKENPVTGALKISSVH